MRPVPVLDSPEMRGPSVKANEDPLVLSTVVYRSRAVNDMSVSELRQLTRASQARNRRESITGLMLYDSGSFFQWLEGPPVGVDRVMGSIFRDSRHTDIEVLDHQTVVTRKFGDWSMKLAAQGPFRTSYRNDVLEPPSEVVEGLRKHPNAAPSLLVRLVPTTALWRAEISDADATCGVAVNRKTAEILKRVILSTVIPTLASELNTSTSRSFLPVASARASELAELLIAADQASAVALIDELHADFGSTPRLYSTVLEPAARTLGDMWSEDVCSEFDLTLGLCRLQTAVRLLTARAFHAFQSGLAQPAVLIVPEPGELHRVGAALDSSILGDAGWSPRCEYPDDDRALQELLSSNWFDVLDLSLSIALRRESWLPRLTETIARARRASQNPSLVVVVGGRVFVETTAAQESVGADAASNTASTVDRSILKTVNRTNTFVNSSTALRQVVATSS